MFFPEIKVSITSTKMSHPLRHCYFCPQVQFYLNHLICTFSETLDLPLFLVVFPLFSVSQYLSDLAGEKKKQKTQFIIITPSHLRPHLLPPLSLHFLSPPPLYPLGPFTLPLPCHHPSLHTFSPPSPSLPPSEHISLLPPCQQRMGG